MYLTILLVILFAAEAMLVREGTWSNVLTLINVILAGIIATCYFEPLAAWIEGLHDWFGSITYALDFFSIWLLFALSFAILRAITDQLSKVRVRFKKPVEYVGSSLSASLVGFVLVCFTAMSLHTAPLSKNFMNGAISPVNDKPVFLGIAPDHVWLGFVRGITGKDGPLYTSSSNGFDPNDQFGTRYGQRRLQFEKTPAFRVRR